MTDLWIGRNRLTFSEVFMWGKTIHALAPLLALLMLIVIGGCKRPGAARQQAAPGTGADWTPLMRAVAEGRLDVVRDLLANGADPNASADGGQTPLMLSWRAGGGVDIVKMLAEA